MIDVKGDDSQSEQAPTNGSVDHSVHKMGCIFSSGS